MSKKLHEMDYGEAELRFTAQPGSMEVVSPRRSWRQKVAGYFKGYGVNVLVQRQHAIDLLGEYERYALSIGCTVCGDSIEATPEQLGKLADWWAEKNHE